jgi:hypothetical protein
MVNDTFVTNVNDFEIGLLMKFYEIVAFLLRQILYHPASVTDDSYN